MPQELGILDILAINGFDRECKTKLVRHQDKRFGMSSLIRDGWFELYQSLQARPVFRGCEQIISFCGDGGTRARFLGVFRVLKERGPCKPKIPKTCPFPEWATNSNYIYDLERRPEFADLEGRLVVDWGDGALAWHQHVRNKPVIEILPKGRVLPPFTDYLEFTLTHRELCDLITTPGAHRDWHSSLSAVAGVYLILAETTGHQYIGSAYGLEGIWGRWRQYANNGHGNNEQLRRLVKASPAYPNAFRYSVLQVLPKTRAAKEIIDWEIQHKLKLGSRATGLNSN